MSSFIIVFTTLAWYSIENDTFQSVKPKVKQGENIQNKRVILTNQFGARLLSANHTNQFPFIQIRGYIKDYTFP